MQRDIAESSNESDSQNGYTYDVNPLIPTLQSSVHAIVVVTSI